MDKHAYLIMVHNDIYILEKLLSLIDNEYNDIYLHIDKKTKNIDLDELKNICKKSDLYIVKRKNVKWSSYSQIECELLLLDEALKNNKYSYYHLLSGVDLVIKDINGIYNYFEENKGMEFISFHSFNEITDLELDRIKYYHILNGNIRHHNRFIRFISRKIYELSLNIQKKIGINRLKNNNLVIRKGANWFSITDDLARYVIENKNIIRKMYIFTFCADEIFLQTLVYNSKYIENVCRKYEFEHQNAKRHIDWNRGNPYTYIIDDYDELMNCNDFFARKFSTNVDKEIIDKIYFELKRGNDE